MKEKRGEVSSFQVITIVLSIVGLFFLLGFLYFAFGDSGQAGSREACKLSVVARATALDELQATVPLKCTTEKICITGKLFGGECGQFAGEENVRTVRLPRDVKEAARIIERESANAMFDCWNMMGQGKLDLFGKFPEKIFGSGGEATCVICSRIAIAEDVQERENYQEILDEIDLNRYLSNENVPGTGKSYWNTIVDDSFNVAPSIENLNLAPNEDKTIKISGISDNQIAFVFSQVRAIKVEDALKNFVGIAVGGSVGLGGLKAVKFLLLTPQGLVTTAVVGGIPLAAVGFNAYEGRSAAAAYCGPFTSAAESEDRNGCSLVQAVNYNVQDINSVCKGGIQGAP